MTEPVAAVVERSLAWLKNRAAHIETCGDCRHERATLLLRNRGEQPEHCYTVQARDDAAALAGALSAGTEDQAQIASLRSVLVPLRELAAKATPWPWKQRGNFIEDLAGFTIATVIETRRENERLIVALVNALPALLKIAGESADTEAGPPADATMASPETGSVPADESER